MMRVLRFSSIEPEPAPEFRQASKPGEAAEEKATPKVSPGKTAPSAKGPAFFTTLPKHRGQLSRLWSGVLDILFPSRTLTPREERLDKLLDKLEADIDAGTLKVDDEAEITIRKWTNDEDHDVVVVDGEGRQYSLSLGYTYKDGPFGKKLIFKRRMSLTGENEYTYLIYNYSKYTGPDVSYHNQDLDVRVASTNRHLTAKTHQVLRKLCKQALKQYHRQLKQEKLRKEIESARKTAEEKKTLPEFRL